jgi:hypothetical protein
MSSNSMERVASAAKGLYLSTTGPATRISRRCGNGLIDQATLAVKLWGCRLATLC